MIPNLGYTEEKVRVCDECFDMVNQVGGKHYQEAPEWKPVVHDEPEWHAPPPADVQASVESSAPPSEESSGANYPDLYKGGPQ